MGGAGFMEKLLDGAKIEWLPLGSITKYEQPTKYLVKSSNYNDTYNTPVLTAGKTFILGYTEENHGIYQASLEPVIIFDDFTSANKWVDFDFKSKSSAMKMITSKDSNRVLLKYIYYWLNTLPSALDEGNHKRLWISKFTNKKIPIPFPKNQEKSLVIQTKIVQILDAMTAVTSELTSELTARKKQYQYYRDKLLNFEEKNVTWKKLDSLAKIKHGKDWKELKTGNIPVYGTGGIMAYVEKHSYNKPSVLIPRKGSITNIFYVDIPFWNIDTIFYTEIDESKIIPKFLYYFINTINLIALDTGSGRPSLTQAILKNILIPIPYADTPEKSLAEQARIVAILDHFDTLTTSLTEGLPREIALRQQQYEYYRDLLLSFPPPETRHAQLQDYR